MIKRRVRTIEQFQSVRLSNSCVRAQVSAIIISYMWNAFLNTFLSIKYWMPRPPLLSVNYD